MHSRSNISTTLLRLHGDDVDKMVIASMLNYKNLSFQENLEILSGLPQKRAIAFIERLIERSPSFADSYDFAMAELGYRENQDQAFLLEVQDLFALALSHEHSKTDDILLYLSSNHDLIFSHTEVSCKIYEAIDAYNNASKRQRVEFHSTQNEKPRLRCLATLNSYFNYIWNQELSFLIVEDKIDVVEKAFELGYITQGELIFELVTLNGDTAERIRMIAYGSPQISEDEAKARVEQLLILAIPRLGNHRRLSGSRKNADFLIEHHLAELEKTQNRPVLADLDVTFTLHLALVMGSIDEPWEIMPTEEVAAFTTKILSRLRFLMPNLGDQLYSVIRQTLDNPKSLTSDDDSNLGITIFDKVLSMVDRKFDQPALKLNQSSLHRCYIGMLKAWGEKALVDFPKHYTGAEALLAYRLLGYSPLVAVMSPEERSLAFGADLGI